MNTRLREYRLLWRAAATHASPRLSAIIRWGVSLIALVIGAAVAYNDGARAALAWFWCAASVCLLLYWAGRFMPGAVTLNTPANAQLVPHMRRRLVELSCLVCLVGIAGIASAPYANADSLGPWLFWTVVLIVGTGLGTAGHAAGSAVIMAAGFGSIFLERVPDTLVALLSHPLVVVLSLPLYAAVIAVAVHAMLPQAGERHWNMLARRARWSAAAGKSDPLVRQLAGKRAMDWYAASLRRASARRDGRRLVLHALGPTHHPSEIVFALGTMVLVLLAVGIFTTWRVDAGVAQGIGWVFACMLLVLPLMHGVRLGQLSGSQASEQALVRLAPAVPARAGAFNTMLGRALLRQALAAWLLASAAALLLVALAGADGRTLLNMASLCCMILPVVAVPLRNHASRGQSAAAAAATLLLISVVESSIAGAVVNAFTTIPALPVAALVSIGFTVVVVVRGLRTMRQSPCAFPAGRID